MKWKFGNKTVEQLTDFNFHSKEIEHLKHTYFFVLNFENRVARKLRRLILLHFGLLTFRFHFGKPENLSFHPDHAFPYQLRVTLETPNDSQQLKDNYHTISQNTVFGHLRILENKMIENAGKHACRTSLKIRLLNS